MSKKMIWVGLLVLALMLTGCDSQEPPTATPSPAVPPDPATATPTTDPEPLPVAQEGILISEVLPGIHGVDNNLEFVELYNAGDGTVDLRGWSLWYRLADNKEEERIYFWREAADIPGHGHFLLVRAGKDVGNIGDAEFDSGLFEKKGGLALRNQDGETVDTLVWGEGPTDYLTGSPALAPEDGASLERLPGGDQGNASSSGDNGADFTLNPSPMPQNSGDLLTPLPDKRLVVSLNAPASVEPGSEVAFVVAVQNLTGELAQNLRARLPVPPEFEIVSLPDGANQSDGWLEWTIAELANGAAERGEFVLQSPWTYLSTLTRGYYVETGDERYRAYGPLLPIAVKGGSIPIGTARTLKGKTVTVEGVATMYTGGFYAGSTGTKFYLEDESGGIQAYCPGGMGLVNVDVGDIVRVSGLIDIYRDSVEIIPDVYPDDVKILEVGGEELVPIPASLKEVASDENLLGRLIVVEGLATRIDEYSYSYEVDLMDDEGNLLLVYVDKETGMSTEPLDIGKRYRMTGINELYNGQRELLPRFQADLVEVFPPELMLEIQARNSVLPSQAITYTLTVYNHTDALLSNIHVEAKLPRLVAPGSEPEILLPEQVLDGGDWEDGYAFWSIAELDSGQSATVRYVVAVSEVAADLVGGGVQAEGAVAFADQWPDLVVTDPLLTFVGTGVPIWAIQGPGMRSHYARSQATTEGIVIGVFPDLGGFWIQEAETDDYPSTSAGLFVLADEAFGLSEADAETPLELGDLERVSGKVRELSGQTLLHLLAPGDLEVISSGNLLPAAVEVDPPLDDEEARVYYEALEGMLVQVTEPILAVGPTSKYGETPLVRPDWGVERIMKGDPKGLMIFMDDGSSRTHYDLSTLAFPVKTGDTVTDLAGPLAYTYENYKIEPIHVPVVESADRPLPSLEPPGANEFSIATFNVENMFDPHDPHPSDPPIPSSTEYRLDLAKTADAILAMGAPTIVGLQEVENIDILADLAGQESIAEYAYEPALVEGTDSRGIDVGYLVRSDQATLEGAANYPAPEGLTSRPPLLITVTVHLEGGDQTVYVLNNHFTSMSGGEKLTEPRRKAQAAWNVELVERILASNPEAHVVVLGDLNSFYESPPMDVLRDAGLRHVYEFVEPERPYSYIYQGESETLDHIWVTPSLYDNLARVEALHINADYPPPIPDDPSARGMSDHDPIVVIFAFE